MGGSGNLKKLGWYRTRKRGTTAGIRQGSGVLGRPRDLRLDTGEFGKAGLFRRYLSPGSSKGF